MIYVALLRGINVGGNNKVDMKQLKEVFEELGLEKVKTYINSGNIIFEDKKHTPAKLVAILEKAIVKAFGLNIKVLVRDQKNLEKVAKTLPASWVNDATMKTDVMFLWEQIDKASVLDELPPKKDFEDIKYVPGAILWRVDRDKLTRSSLLRLAGTPLYKEMTIRNCNTVRKLVGLMREIESID